MCKNFLNTISVFALAVFLGGCATVENAREAQKPENRLPGERTVSAEEAGLKSGSVVELSALEKIALHGNPSILQARQKVVSAQLALKNVKADYMPTADFKTGYTRATNNTNPHSQSSASAGKYTAGLSINLLIYDFGKTDAKVRKAAAELIAAEKDLIATENEVIYNVRKAYFELCRCIGLNEVATQTVAQYKAHYDQMRAKMEVGKGTKYDCTKAEVDWNNSLLASITTANNVSVAHSQLNLALGLAATPQYSVRESGMKVFPADVDELVKIARRDDPAYASLCASADAATEYVSQKICELYPDIGIDVGAALQADSNLGLPWLWNLTGAGTISQNVFNGGRNMNAIEDAVAQLRIARSKVAAYELDLYSKIREAVLELERAGKQYDVAALSSRSAWENLDIVTERFKVGKASSLDRTDAQVSLSSSRSSLVSAKYDYQEALAAIAYLVGDNE